MLCLKDRPEERHLGKMCFPPAWEIKLRPLSSVLSRPPTWEHLSDGAGADIIGIGHWFGISPKLQSSSKLECMLHLNIQVNDPNS